MSFDPSERWARAADAGDPLREMRDAFLIPADPDGNERVYLCGHSLGLQPKATRGLLDEELALWATEAVDGHFKGARPWYSYHEQVRAGLAAVVGAREHEVVAMNSLSTNLHLLMVSFYRPTARRRKILIESTPFPSDLYAMQTQLAFHGHDPAEDLIVVGPRDGEATLRTEDVVERIDDDVALVMLGGVNYYTGQAFDLATIAQAAKAKGCVVGFDLAHAAGNRPLALHDWEVDFAVWCSYKYLNSGPGAVGGAFVHERNSRDRSLPRFGGWWGNDPDTRFRMHLEERFVPVASADGWQLSNPPILALAPLIASLELFERAGMSALRKKSLELTGYLEAWVRHAAGDVVRLLTPTDPDQRGCQLSLHVSERALELFEALQAAWITVDFRRPDVIRVAPVPLYNRFDEIRRVGETIAAWAAR